METIWDAAEATSTTATATAAVVRSSFVHSLGSVTKAAYDEYESKREEKGGKATT